MAKSGSLPIRWPVCTTLFLVLLTAVTTVNAAKSTRTNRNIYRLGISPIIPGDERNRGGTTEAWVEIFSLTKSKRDVSRQSPTPGKLLSKQAFGGSMAFLNGVADVFCFRMNRCYANMMTGNTIKFASALGELRLLDTLQFASLLLSYALGCTIYRAMVHFHTLETSSKPHAAARSTASLLILAMFAWSDFLFFTKSGMGANGWIHVVPLTIGFGLLNAATSDALGGTIAFALTGHVSKVSQGLSDWMFATPGKRHFRSASKLSARILVGFVLGILAANRLASAGSHHVLMEASGATLPSFLVGDNNLPLFSIVGIVAVTLMQLYDRPMPRILWQFLALFKSAKQQEANNMVVNLWAQRTN